MDSTEARVLDLRYSLLEARLAEAERRAGALSFVDGLPGVSEADLCSCVRVLERVVDATDATYTQPLLRPLRQALGKAVLRAQAGMYVDQRTGKRVGQHEWERERRAQNAARRQRQREQAHDRQWVNNTALRAGRMARLAALRQSSDEAQVEATQLMVPDGPGGAEHVGGVYPPALRLLDQAPSRGDSDASSSIISARALTATAQTTVGNVPAGGAVVVEDHAARAGNARGRMRYAEAAGAGTQTPRAGGSGGATEVLSSMSSPQLQAPSVVIVPAAAPAAACPVPAQASGAVLATAEPTPVRLHRPRNCYVCRRRFTKLHAFYDRLCPPCAQLNWLKRHQTADLRGMVAIVTGARVKIGYHVALKLLRAGCAAVIATTRFPRDAASRFAAELDAAKWQSELHVFGLDLRDIAAVDAFAAFVGDRFGRVDVVINNACQTVRRPASYYKQQVQRERTLALAEAHDVAAAAEAGAVASQAVPGVSALLAAHASFRSSAAAADGRGTAAAVKPSTNDSGVAPSALLSQLALMPDDAADGSHIHEDMPAGATDVNGQQIDLRRCNSWLLPLEQVQAPELVEVMAINSIAPFVLNSRLHQFLVRPRAHASATASTAAAEADGGDRTFTECSFVINVSAQEGKFYRYKTPNHPHTNMAKAALNMMTRTSAEAWAAQGILMNSVDTGWINDENPRDKAARIAKDHDFQTPIDEVDAAARILDPVFTGVAEGQRSYGQFFKDYRPSEW